MDKSKKTVKHITVGIVLMIVLSGCANVNSNDDTPKAIDGVLDLTNWKLEEELISLDGHWEFYWDKLLEPRDLKNINNEERIFINLPRAWNQYQHNNEILSGNGHATYRLNIVTEDSGKLLGLKIPRMLTSYKMWINGEVVASAGTVGKAREFTIPQYLPQVVVFQSQNKTEIVIQVSNYHHRSGGILESLTIGSAKQILDVRNRKIAYELFLFGCLFIMGLYHLALFGFRRKEMANLYFGMFCIFVAVRTLLVGEIFFIYLFPNFNWQIAHKIQTLSFYLGIPTFLLFFKSVFPDEISSKVIVINKGIALAFGLLVLLTPANVFTRMNSIYQLFALAMILYLMYTLLRILYKKETEARLIGLGGIILLMTTINDVIFLSVWMAHNDHVISIVKSGNLSSFGQLIFVFTHSLALAKKFSDALMREEKMTNDLRELNENLDRLVEVRTKDLELSNKKIQQQKIELGKKNKELKLLSSKDPLTDLWNRRYFDETIELEWRRGLRFKKPISLIMIDIDYFKSFNDYYGHQEGDACLKLVANELKNSFSRSGELVARLGGEEFISIMPNVEGVQAFEMAEKIRGNIEKLKISHSKSVVNKYITISLGVSTMIPDPHFSQEDLILAADKAMYSAKKSGRNKVVVLDVSNGGTN